MGAAPKLVSAVGAVVAPVPPFAMAIAVPLQVPAVIVPTVFKLLKEVNEVLDVAVMLTAELAFAAKVAVAALPVVF